MQIGLLGALMVQDDAGRPVRVGGRRVRLLLILLALDAGRVVPVSSLTERLWDDSPPGNAGNSLQSHVSRLRSSLRQAGLGEGVIESHPAGYRLAVSPHEVDALVFEDLAAEGSRALGSGDPAAARRTLDRALGAWRGPALADAAGESFAAGPAARLEELRAQAALDLAEARLALGESDGLVGDLRAMIAADPAAERPRGLLMRALYAAGRQAEALAVYEEMRGLLADRLGVDPSPQLERVYLGVLRRDLPQAPPASAGPPPGDHGPMGAGLPRRMGPAEPAPSSAQGRAGAGPGPGKGRHARGGVPRGPWPTGARTPLTSFVGREEDVARVLEMLAVGRLVTLTGPGGAGKTRLAIEVAAVLAGKCACSGPSLAGDAASPGPAEPAAGPSGALERPGPADPRGPAPPGVVANAETAQPAWGCPARLVELAPVTDPGEVADAALHALGIRDSPMLARAGAGQPGAPTDPAQRLVTALAARRELLILDNCEHVVAAAAALADQILADCPEVRVLATSREPLRIAGEALWPVSTLPVPPEPAQPAPDAGRRPPAPDGSPPAPKRARAAASGLADDYAAVRLLADRAAAALPEFRVDTGNAADVARICRALDGIPLAIELAAARLRTMSAAQLARRLDARFDLLTGGSRTAGPRHQTLRAVVDWSWELLSAPEQVLARRLAAFPGGATLDAAEQVCQDAELPGGAVVSALFGLVEKSLLTVDAGDDPRYRMLETVRAYCRERLADSGEEDRARHAFASHFLLLAETADPLLRGAEQRTWMRRLTAEQDNIHAALRWAIDHGEAAMALRFGLALGWFWLLRGQRRESATLAREILATSEKEGGGPDSPGFDALDARVVCAVTAVNSSWDLTEVRRPLADAEALLARGPGDGPGARPPHPLVVLAGAMLALYEKRDPELALTLVAAQYDSPDPWIRAGSRLMHMFFSITTGRMEDVAGECAEALAGFRAIGDRWGASLALTGQAELASLAGDHRAAVAALEEAVELSRELTDWEDAAHMHARLARSRGRLGDQEGALADMAHAEQIARAQGEPEADLVVSYTRAELAWLRGDVAEAGAICQELDRRLASKPAAMGWSFRALVQARGALASVRAGDHAGGRAGLASALRLARDSQDRSAVAAVLDALAAAALPTGDGRAAERAAAERAAGLLGAAHALRGAFDHASLDAPAARDAARLALGDAGFVEAYQRGRSLGDDGALALAEEASPAAAQA